MVRGPWYQEPHDQELGQERGLVCENLLCRLGNVWIPLESEHPLYLQ